MPENACQTFLDLVKRCVSSPLPISSTMQSRYVLPSQSRGIKLDNLGCGNLVPVRVMCIVLVFMPLTQTVFVVLRLL